MRSNLPKNHTPYTESRVVPSSPPTEGDHRVFQGGINDTDSQIS